MKLKLTFLLPNLHAANQACERLLLARVSDNDMHFLAQPGVALGKLQAATMLEKSNMVHEGQRGILMGAGVGLVAGLYVLIVPAWITVSPLWYTNTTWYVVLFVTILAGALALALGAGLLGENIFNSDLKHYKNSIDKGGILMIVSVPFYRAGYIKKMMATNAQTLAPIPVGVSAR